ncbi:SAM domain containing protein SAMSN-1 [Dissostichus eleginoides]|uniref:SAM domain containing protein SAMSN-1 n=1 Tax=Dissostichus eleginoides TaxID=100907 RepID=A0AAD9BFM7_DISEL|nr:SAM domain containing protein SAMSN-1 [Dissostichus eleginoides]
MNLFCFSLEGSSDSIYEAPYRQTRKEVLPKHQCSPSLQRPEWGGSDPSISSDRPQSTVKVKRNNRRSHVPTSHLDNETLDIDRACWMSSAQRQDLCHQSKEMCKAPCQSSRLTRDDRTRTDLPAQGAETADTAESICSTGSLKRLKNLHLLHTKKGHQRGAAAEKRTSENNVLSCIGLGKRTEKKPPPAPSPQYNHQAKDYHVDSEEEGGWSPQTGNVRWNPFECSQPWTPLHHTCHQHELPVCGGTLTPHGSTQWDRFESLIQELDSKQSDLCPPEMTLSITDLQLSQDTLSRFGRFDAFRQSSPVMKPQDNESALQGETSSDWKHVKTSPEKAAVSTGNKQRDEAEKRKVGVGRSSRKAHRRSRNSLESLYSLHSGQSSSSGVTSGSDCSSNRDSLRLEDDLLCTRQFCGRAKVHTDFVPSPYDTESLKLKEGDVIDIIAKPPMGIWTGMLNGRIGNFKFIYVEVLTEDSPDAHKETQTHKLRQNSTVQEVLKCLNMEVYSSSFQQHGYKTVDDLLRLREHHLTELNVTDPELRHRLLAAVRSLQQPCSDHLADVSNQEAGTSGENTKEDLNNCPRDSGCHMPSDSTKNITEQPDLEFVSDSEDPLPAEQTVS